MKRILFFLPLLFYLVATGQPTGAIINPSLDGQPANKPIIVTGAIPMDGKYYYYNPISRKWRPFISTIEALTRIPIEQRYWGLRVMINIGGSLSGDKITGGTYAEYWFKDNLTTLVPSAASGGGGPTDTSNLSDRINGKLNVTDTANKWIRSIEANATGDSIVYYKSGVRFALFFNPAGWSKNGNNLSNTNSGYVLVNGEFKVGSMLSVNPSTNLFSMTNTGAGGVSTIVSGGSNGGWNVSTTALSTISATDFQARQNRIYLNAYSTSSTARQGRAYVDTGFVRLQVLKNGGIDNQLTLTDTGLTYSDGGKTAGIIMAGIDTSKFNNNSVVTKGWALARMANLTSSGTITAVSGTTNRITSTGGTAPVLDISAAFENTLVKLTGAQTLTGKTLTSPVINSPTGIVKADVGLSNVDNTSDAGKPVSAAQAAAIAAKLDITGSGSSLTGVVNTSGTQSGIAGNKTWTGVHTYSNNTVYAAGLQITSGTPAAGKFLMSDASGNASWSDYVTTGVIATYNEIDPNAPGGIVVKHDLDSVMALKQNVSSTPIVLFDNTTVTMDMSLGYNAVLTLAGNRTLAITNVQPGQIGLIRVVQDGTGSRTLALPANSKVMDGGAGIITLSTGAGAVDIVTFYYDGANFYWNIGTNYN